MEPAPCILVVDDNLDCANETAFYLQHKGGYRVEVAASGEEALRRTAEWTPDVILLDVHMPGLNGFEVCQELRRNAATLATPVVFVTSRVDSDAVVRGLEVGADDYICKPYQPLELLARIRAMLRLRALQRRLIEQERLAALVQLAGGAAHELNQPLTIVLGYLELLKADLPGSARAQERFDRIYAAALRMGEIIERMGEIRSYRTRDYVAGERIVDLEASASESE